MVYKEVKRGRLYEEIVSQVQDLIVQEQLQVGDKLPPERQLIEQFGVSRTVLREAFRALEEKGLIEVKHGSGAYIAQPSPNSVSESIALHLRMRGSSLMALLEVREILEVEIVALAAERATEEDIEGIEKALRHEAQVLGSPDDYVEADLRFHELLAMAAHNEVLPILVNPLGELLRESRRITGTWRTGPSLQSHKEIFQAVKNKDKEQAREKMHQHLQNVKKDMEYLVTLTTTK